MANGLHINGVSRPGDGAVRTLVDPATGDPVDEIAESTPSQVSEAVAAARSAQPRWAEHTAGSVPVSCSGSPTWSRSMRTS